ncbi:SPFH/Band 7/PHB domain protein [Kineosporia rhizophila]|uniref:SPFH domain-containing protein n=1 Tax=Kineosporia TaxID=49184 RepID=UPI001E29F20C|nr:MULTISPECIES: SPFH domain-containing protein [Kineosporia]MCE0539411.1 SPFH/Band 7/PHB domain protein [Kineosporia rhizophila]GLY18412.1 paraslipin [Kineosporia sp. NBRC 101677]
MEPGDIVLLVVLALVVLMVGTTIAKAIRIVPQATTVLVERLGRYSRTLEPGLHFLVPFVDRPRAVVDMREQVVSFPPQPVITSDNLVVSIDSVIYFQPTDPKAAVYEIYNYIQGIEQLTVTTLRNVIGSLDLEQTLTSRDQINGQLRGVLDDATGRWGIRVNRVELKAIDPPASVQDSMEKQMRAERDRRAAILNAEGVKQSQILTAEGDKQSAILRAEGQAQAAVLKAQGESKAILQVFDAIHRGDADPKLLAYQYLQMLPQIANGTASKMWIVPTELTQALGSISGALGGDPETIAAPSAARYRERDTGISDNPFDGTELEDPNEALERARQEAAGASAEADADARKVSGAGGLGSSATPPGPGPSGYGTPPENA